MDSLHARQSGHLFLASGSPRRAELLRQIGVRFAKVAIDVAERRQPQETPEAYVKRLALSKARAGVQKLPAGSVVLGADTIGLLDGQVLEKPRSQSHGAAMLRAMSGRSHHIITAVALACGTRETVAQVATEVHFRPLTESQINAYWHTGEPQDKAGGYAIQGLAAVFVSRISGSYSNVVGLPLETTAALLAQYNIPLWQSAQREQG